MKKYLFVLLSISLSVSVLAANGDYNDPATASGTNWTTPTNVFLDDGSRAAYNAATQDNLFVTNFTIGAASTATMDSIIVRINGHAITSSADNRRIDVSLTKNGTSEVGDVVTVVLNQDTDADIIVRGSTDDLWGTTWTLAEINATTFGVTINKFNTNTNNIRIDHVQVKVWWSWIITGTAYIDEGVTPIGAGNTVRLLVNGSSAGTGSTNGSGAYSIGAIVNMGDAILAYVDGGSIKGLTVTVSDGNNLSGFDIYEDHVIARHDNSGSLSITDMDAALGSYSDMDIKYSVTGGDLTIISAHELYVPSGHTFVPGGNVTSPHVEILGSVTAGSNTFTVTSNWDASGGTFTPDASTVKFTSATATFTPGTSSYNDIIVELSTSAQILTLGSNLDVNNDLTITLGKLDVSASNYSITIGGDFSNSDVFTAQSGTVTLDGANQTISGSTTFYNLTKSVTTAATLTFQASQTQTIGGTVTLNGAAANLLSLRSSTLGTRWNFTVNAGATKAIDYVDFQDSDASGSDASQKPINPTNSVDSGNNVDWIHIIVSGTVYTDEGITNAGSGKTVRLIVEGVDVGTDVTDAVGGYSITASINTGDAMLVYIDQETIDATTVTVSDGADLSGFDIYVDHVITRHDNSGSLTNTDMDNAKGAFSDAEIEYSVSAGAVTVPSPNELYVPSGHTFVPVANVTSYDVKILGTLDGGSYTLTVQKNWDASSGTFTAGTSALVFTLTSATFTAGVSAYNNVTFTPSNPSQTLTLGSALDANGDLTISLGTLDVSTSNYAITVGGNFSNSGTFTAQSGTVTLDSTNQTISGSTTFYNLTKSVTTAATLTFQAGQTQTIGGTVTLNGAAANLLSLRSSTPGTRWNFIVNAGATKAIDYVDFQDSDASGSDASQKPINPTNSVNSGNNVNWVAPTISGIVYTDEGVTNAGSGLTVRLILNGVDVGTDVTDAGGAYSITAEVNPGDAMLVYIDQEAIDGTTVTVSDGADFSGFDLYADHVITQHDNGGSLTNGNMGIAKGAFSDSEILYTVSAGALTVISPNELYVPTGHTFDPGEDVTAPHIKIIGTILGGSDILMTSGNWDASTGTYTPGTSTVKFTSSSATFTAGTSSYYDVTLELTDNSQILTLASDLDVNNNLTITTGDLDVSATNYNITVGGDYSNSGIFTARNGTVTFDGTIQSISGSTTFYNLTKSVASVDTLTFQIGTTQTFDGTVTLNGVSGNLLSLVSSSPGSQWSFTVNAGATKTISFVDVEDSDAINSGITQRTINPSNSVDGGNNLEWFSTALGVSISNSTFAFGTVLLSTWLTAQSSIVKNSGQSVANMIGKISQFTTGGDNWDISATTNGADSVRSQWSTTSSTGPWSDISAYDSDFTIVSTLAVDGTVTLWFRIETPTTTTSNSQYSSTLTVTAQ